MKPEEESAGRFGRHVTLIITNTTKVAGLVLAVKEIFTRASPRTLEVIVAIIMMMGGQLSEELVLGLVARFLGVDKRASKGKDADR